MSTAPAIFDRPLARARLDRAARAQDPGAWFLVERAAEDLAERLAAVLRQFGVAVDMGTPTSHGVAALRASGRADSVFRLAPAEGAAHGTMVGVPTAVADEERLPLAPESVDLAVSLLSLQLANDLPGVLTQIRRALRPDGLFLGCLVGGATLTELRQSFTQAEAEIEGGASPHVAPFADVRDMGGLLQRAGFALPVTDLDSFVVRYASPLGLLADLRAMGATNVLFARRRTPLRRATLMRMVEIYAERFSDPDGKVRATFELVWLSGWAPHESQQKPLRPGSAKARLADALGVVENPTPAEPNPPKT